MMSVVQRDKIVNSYSEVLVQILNNLKSKDEAKKTLKELLEIADDEVFSHLIVNPMNIAGYKSIIGGLKTKFEHDNELQNFLLEVLDRRYGNLLCLIVSKAERKLQKTLEIRKVIIVSGSELDENTKSSVEKSLQKRTNCELEFSYQIDKNIEDGAVNIIIGNKICSINVDNVVEQVMKI